MTQQDLHKSIAKLREISPKLNAATDEVSATTRRVVEFLRDECKIGLPAWQSLGAEDYGPQDARRCRTSRLLYDRIDGKFDIAVEVSTMEVQDDGCLVTGTDEQELFVTLTKAPREWKFRGFAAIPGLLEQIAEEAERIINKAQESSSTISSVLAALGEKTVSDSPHVMGPNADLLNALAKQRMAKEAAPPLVP
jgi:hypothetical protein